MFKAYQQEITLTLGYLLTSTKPKITTNFYLIAIGNVALYHLIQAL